MGLDPALVEGWVKGVGGWVKGREGWVGGWESARRSPAPQEFQRGPGPAAEGWAWVEQGQTSVIERGRK
jgi:hypothetical protein